MIAGIKIKIYWWVLLLPLYLLLITVNHCDGFDSAFYEAVYFALLITFLALLPHELGHAVSSRFFGVKKGVLHIAGLVGGWEPDDSDWKRLNGWQKNIVYAAGPAANFALYGICCLLLLVFDLSVPVKKMIFATQTLNYWMAVINLLPMFPLDGGRLIHAAIACFSFTVRQVRWLLALLTLLVGAVRLLSIDEGEYWYVTAEIVLMVGVSLLVICFYEFEEYRAGYEAPLRQMAVRRDTFTAPSKKLQKVE